jgi:ubiquinone/menaquinone biosynthesis C-methylase UbiE
MGKVVLDIGCGASHETINFLKDFSLENATVIGVDWNLDFCKQSRQKARRHRIEAEYLRCDAAFLPFQDETFDIVCMLDSLRCLKGRFPQQFIREAWRKLKPKGKLYVTGFDKVCFQNRALPVFKDRFLPLSWNVYIPLNGSSPWISHEPCLKKNYRYVGVLPEKVISELLWRCGIEPETKWKVEEIEDYTYYKYVVTAEKFQV